MVSWAAPTEQLPQVEAAPAPLLSTAELGPVLGSQSPSEVASGSPAKGHGGEGLEHLSRGHGLRELGLPGLEEPQRDPVSMQSLQGGAELSQGRARLCQRCQGPGRSHGHQLEQGGSAGSQG